MKVFFILLFASFYCCLPLAGQALEKEELQALVQRLKADERGPYKDIRWFCSDGSIQPAKEPCTQAGGVQRARYKDQVVNIAKQQHLYLGQILATTPNADFWDADYYNSRLKQYQLEKYLQSVDNGWIAQRAQYYRGSIQVEDEEAWGIQFFKWLLPKDTLLRQQFFLIRQAAKDIPHRGDDNLMQRVRSVSKSLSDSYPAFQDLRVKIHGRPEAADRAKVMAFQQTHQAKLSSDQQREFSRLIADLETLFAPVNLKALEQYLGKLPKEAAIHTSLANYIQEFDQPTSGPARLMATAEQLAAIREEITQVPSAKARLALLDLSLALEQIFFTEVQKWQPRTVGDAMEKVCYTGLAVMGTGYVETWEYEQLLATFRASEDPEISLADLNTFVKQAQSLAEWSSGMVYGVYKDVVQLYGHFEPLANGFYDDRIRSSNLLPLGQAVADLSSYLTTINQTENKVLGGKGASFRGLNPGFALGELVVITDQVDEIEVDRNKIYAFQRPPSDLKPVAGILTVTEGNMVSHVQLLARNLAIPNAVLSGQDLQTLRAYSGQRIFYAVTNQGRVIIKPSQEMTAEEKALFTNRARSEERITVPVDKLELAQTDILNLRAVNAASSGKTCGPKAANLGQLKQLFPDKVVEGLVLPFGVFRQHMDQSMPEASGSYWDFLQETFTTARRMETDRKDAAEIETYVLDRLSQLSEAIKKMPLLPGFLTALEESFSQVLQSPLGQVPVFLRSDTNMEDLKDFTGAGLNLTLFNVVEREKIIQGIKDVWASPYSERSFRWRQRYLLNPENVFPSILIIPSVDVDYSGVVITKGITNDEANDLTIAFSRGAGGAVDGQAAESYLLTASGHNVLLSPAREAFYRRLPATGGTSIRSTTFTYPILNAQNMADMRHITQEIRRIMPTAVADANGPYDIELGFQNNQLWLFQIRPFVENKKAGSLTYLSDSPPPRTKCADGKKICPIKLTPILQ